MSDKLPHCRVCGDALAYSYPRGWYHKDPNVAHAPDIYYPAKESRFPNMNEQAVEIEPSAIVAASYGSWDQEVTPRLKYEVAYEAMRVYWFHPDVEWPKFRDHEVYGHGCKCQSCLARCVVCS